MATPATPPGGKGKQFKGAKVEASKEALKPKPMQDGSVTGHTVLGMQEPTARAEEERAGVTMHHVLNMHPMKAIEKAAEKVVGKIIEGAKAAEKAIEKVLPAFGGSSSPPTLGIWDGKQFLVDEAGDTFRLTEDEANAMKAKLEASGATGLEIKPNEGAEA